jgi:hypothetical protein
VIGPGGERGSTSSKRNRKSTKRHSQRADLPPFLCHLWRLRIYNRDRKNNTLHIHLHFFTNTSPHTHTHNTHTGKHQTPKPCFVLRLATRIQLPAAAGGRSSRRRQQPRTSKKKKRAAPFALRRSPRSPRVGKSSVPPGSKGHLRCGVIVVTTSARTA